MAKLAQSGKSKAAKKAMGTKKTNQGGRKKGLTKKYNAYQISIVEKHAAEKWGPGRIAKAYPDLG